MTIDERDAPIEAPDPHDAAVAVLAESAPPGGSDEERPHPAPTPEEAHVLHAGAVAVLRRGVAATPELRQGILFTGVMALATAAGKLAVPILIQQILDRGVPEDAAFRPGFVYPACALTAVGVVLLYLVNRATYLRLVRASENSLLGLRAAPEFEACDFAKSKLEDLGCGGGHSTTSTGCRWRSTTSSAAVPWWPGSPATSRPWPSSWNGERWRGSSTASSSSPPSA